MWAPSRSNSSAVYIQAKSFTVTENALRGKTHHHQFYISDFCFYLFKYFNKTYINNLSMIDDDEDMPPLLSDMHFDDES